MADIAASATRTSICAAICTYQRNEPMRRLLDSLADAANDVRDRADVGVVVVDDNADGGAEPAVAQAARDLADAFPLGIHYRTSGKQNISMARNVGLETASSLADWIAMTDDDCIVAETWFRHHLAAQSETMAHATTGSMLLRFPESAPPWIHDQPFNMIGLLEKQHLALMEFGATNNSLISSAWLHDHPEIRFDPELGVLGGEDMVFYRAAVAEGLRVHYVKDAPVYEIGPEDRATLRYQLSRALWMGNTMSVTHRRAHKTPRLRLALRGVRRVAEAWTRLGSRLVHRKSPQVRFTLARTVEGAGQVVGAAGIELDHR